MYEGTNVNSVIFFKITLFMKFVLEKSKIVIY